MSHRAILLRPLSLVLIAALAVSSLAGTARADAKQQELVDRARITVESMKRDGDAGVYRTYIRKAHAVVVIPEFVKAGFVIGGAVGNGVILGRDPKTKTFTTPAFVRLSEGSIGLQIGAESSEIIMTVLTEKGLAALLDDKFTIGGQAGITVLTVGAGRAGATTANLDADIVTFGRSKGLFGGISLDGTVFTHLNDANAAYYGAPLTVEEIVLEIKGHNSGADALRAQLDNF